MLKVVVENDAGTAREGALAPFTLPVWSNKYLLQIAMALVSEYAWTGTDEEVKEAQKDAQELVRRLIEQMDGLVEDVRVTGGKVETLKDGVWTIVMNGDIREWGCGCQAEPPPTGHEDELGHMCSGSKGLLEYTLETIAESYDLAAAIVNGIQTVGNAVLDLLSLGTYENSPYNQMFDALAETGETVLGLYAGVCRNEGFKEEQSCRLYCLIKANEGVFTEEIYTEFLEGIESSIPYAADAIRGSYLTMYTFDLIRRRYWIYSMDSSDTCEALCSECGAIYWCGTWSQFLSGTSNDIYSLPDNTDPSKTYRITFTGSFAVGNPHESFIRDGFYVYLDGWVYDPVLILDMTSTYEAPAFNPTHEYVIDVSGDTNTWRFYNHELGSTGDNTVGDLNVVVECLG